MTDAEFDAATTISPTCPKPALTELVATRVTRADYLRIEAIALADGRSIAGWVRKLLIERLGEGAIARSEATPVQAAFSKMLRALADLTELGALSDEEVGPLARALLEQLPPAVRNGLQ